MNATLAMALVAVATSVMAADLRSVALSVISGRELGAIPPAVCFDPMLPSGISGWTGTVAMVDAATNRADVLALAAQLDGAAKQPQDFPNGIAVPDITRSNVMVSVVAVDGMVVGVDSHASPFDYAAYTNRLAQANASNAVARAELRGLIEGVKTSRSNLNAVTFGAFTAAQSNQLDRLRNRTDAVARDLIQLERWIKKNIVKDPTPEATPQ